MVGYLVAALALLAAPEDDAAAKLRVAWASQYEWKEDGVRNITLEFEYSGGWKGRDNQEFEFRGKGHVVVADGELVRRHLPSAGPDQRARLESELDWVVARFLRPSFDEKFADVEFGAPENLANDVIRIPAGDVAFLLGGERLVGIERDIGTPEKPFPIRVAYTPGEMGTGYGVLEERTSYTRNMVKQGESRRLTLRQDDGRPAPQRLMYERDEAEGRYHVEIVFAKPTVNAEDPVVLAPAARERLKAAWARQYRLPRDIRIEGAFQRRLDRELKRSRWTPNVKGKFQVWGLDSVEVVVKETQGGERTQNTCRDHLQWAFGLFDVKPFDEEFRGCGFGLEDRGDGTSIVSVYGHPVALAYRVANGRIVGRLGTGATQVWWDYDVEEGRDGMVMIKSMTSVINGKKRELPFRYGKVDGHLVPKSVAALGTPPTGGAFIVFGVAEYRFSRMKASLPD
jgi:hypothetical protein